MQSILELRRRPWISLRMSGGTGFQLRDVSLRLARCGAGLRCCQLLRIQVPRGPQSGGPRLPRVPILSETRRLSALLPVREWQPTSLQLRRRQLLRQQPQNVYECDDDMRLTTIISLCSFSSTFCTIRHRTQCPTISRKKESEVFCTYFLRK